MKIFLLLLVHLQVSFGDYRKKSFSECHKGKNSLYDFPLNDIHGLKFASENYKNHVSLVINVATF